MRRFWRSGDSTSKRVLDVLEFFHLRRQTDDRRQTDGRRHIANMNISSRSLITYPRSARAEIRQSQLNTVASKINSLTAKTMVAWFGHFR